MSSTKGSFWHGQSVVGKPLELRQQVRHLLLLPLQEFIGLPGVFEGLVFGGVLLRRWEQGVREEGSGEGRVGRDSSVLVFPSVFYVFSLFVYLFYVLFLCLLSYVLKASNGGDMWRIWGDMGGYGGYRDMWDIGGYGGGRLIGERDMGQYSSILGFYFVYLFRSVIDIM